MVRRVREWPEPPRVVRYAATKIKWLNEEISFDQNSVLSGCSLINCEVHIAEGVTVDFRDGCTVMGNRFDADDGGQVLLNGRAWGRKPIAGQAKHSRLASGRLGKTFEPD